MLWKEQDQDHDYWLFGKLQGQFIRVMNVMGPYARLMV